MELKDLTEAVPGLDIEAVRRDTPGLDGDKLIHLNNAGASLMPRVVIETQIAHLQREGAIGGYEAAGEAGVRIEAVYQSLATLLNAQPQEIALVENATVGWRAAFAALPLGPGDKVILTDTEYASNYLTMMRAREMKGIDIQVVPNDDKGDPDLAALKGMIDGKTKLIAVSHIPTNGGQVSPVKEIGAIARAAGVAYFIDACQSAGQRKLDVEEIGCDVLAASGRKYLRGPRGTGFLYVRKGFLDTLNPPELDLHSATWTGTNSFTMRDDARRFENWEQNYAAILGLGAAVDYLLALDQDFTQNRITWLGRRLRSILRDELRLEVYDKGKDQGGIVTFAVPDRSPQEVKAALAPLHINVEVATPLGARLDADARGLPDLIRASVHYFNTDEELSTFVTKLHKSKHVEKK